MVEHGKEKNASCYIRPIHKTFQLKSGINISWFTVFFFATYMIDCIGRCQITEPLDCVTGGGFSLKSKVSFHHNLRPMRYVKAVMYTLKLGTRAL